MGLSPFSSSSGDNKSVSLFSKWCKSASRLTNNTVESLPNPKPDNYKIIKIRSMSPYLLIKIKYLDCTNYEGIKILLFKSTLTSILKANNGLIDPHFCDNSKFISPIARFEPTKEGWINAIKFVKTIRR